MTDPHNGDGEGERNNHDQRDDGPTPRQQPDFAMFTRWTDDTFNHLKTLFQFEVAKHVTTRMLALGSLIFTFLGILSIFGLRQGIDLVVEDIRRNAQNEIAAEIRSELANQMQEMRALIADGTVQLRVTDVLMDRSSRDLNDLSIAIRDRMDKSSNDLNDLSDATRDRIAALASEIDNQVVEVRDRINEIEGLSENLGMLDQQLQVYSQDLATGRQDIDSLLVETRKLVDLSVTPLLSIDSLLGRLDVAGRALAASGKGEPDAHELAVVRAIIETLGAKEFKQQEEFQKEAVVRTLQAIFIYRPPSGSVDYNDDTFREIRVGAINALRSLSERSPLPEAGIRALTEMLEDARRFGERDGAAWALSVLADDDLLVEIDEQVIVGATDGLVNTLTTRDDPEVQRTALQTLRRIATMSEFKSSLISQKSNEKIVATLSSSDEALRKASAEVLRAIVHPGSEEWREEVRALAKDESEEVKRIGVGIQAQVFPDDLVRQAAKEPELERELTAEVEQARRSVAADYKARGRRRFREERWEEAIDNFLRYLELQPDDLGAQREVAELHLLADNYDKAEAMAKITLASASTQRTLDQFIIVAARVMAGIPHAEDTAILLGLAETSPMRPGYWSFDTLREHLNDENTGTPEARAEVLDLILLIERS